ncbi:cupin-like domain-containing protein [Marinimicrobium sp. ABcell2]|uniref:cupin-like domain-containing protein n=1 Tax=Marinimicrobium sp. ABcell2 TaxID=3069751 RepID=UPI0027B85179|nr:cupin-like domain-containing protein [Marinimicrobium sp. ABcell2]MDQ2077162.1 cupin-like domain-containing protein [Marinimicrobium sp. ABcell2]
MATHRFSPGNAWCQINPDFDVVMSLPRVKEWHNVTREMFEQEIVPRYEPAILRGHVKDWPVTRQSLKSAESAARYVSQFDSGRPVLSWVGEPSIEGRFFYNRDLSGMNFQQVQAELRPTLNRILSLSGEERPPALYVGATSVADSLPGFAHENPSPLVDKAIIPNIWLGNQVTISAHFDTSDNIACVVAGRRKFTLFPPEQVSNLYVGPIDFTPAGQPISMVSVKEPDFERFPRFRQALAAAKVAELEPGDAIYIPSLWWHNVEATEDFNILINYWWEDSVPGVGSPFDALVHSTLTTSSLPPEKVAAWKSMFDHYVFEREQQSAEHIPPERRGPLGKMTPRVAAYVRNYLRGVLNR